MANLQEDWIFQNLSKPQGSTGHMVGKYMAVENFEINSWAIELLDIQPEDNILEIGFGPGLAIRDMALLAYEGQVAGIDFSELMYQEAKRLNKVAILEKRVALYHADVAALPVFEKRFDKVLSVNSIMYWNNPVEALTNLRNVMTPGATISIVIQRRDEPFRKGEYDHEIESLKTCLKDAGYCHIQVAASPIAIKRPKQKKQIIAAISIRAYNELMLPALSNQLDLSSLLAESAFRVKPAESVILNHKFGESIS